MYRQDDMQNDKIHTDLKGEKNMTRYEDLTKLEKEVFHLTVVESLTKVMKRNKVTDSLIYYITNTWMHSYSYEALTFDQRLDFHDSVVEPIEKILRETEHPKGKDIHTIISKWCDKE